MEQDGIFKTCPSCSTSWHTRDDFLADKSIVLNGYQVSLKNLEAGLILFTHMVETCKSTMSLKVCNFTDLYKGPRYPDNKALSAECPRYCIDEKKLDRCNALCECAFVREIIQVIREIQTSSH